MFHYHDFKVVPFFLGGSRYPKNDAGGGGGGNRPLTSNRDNHMDLGIDGNFKVMINDISGKGSIFHVFSGYAGLGVIYHCKIGSE